MSDECEQYVYVAYGRKGGPCEGESLRVFESPLESGGTLFMIETVGGDERDSFTSEKQGWAAVRDMRAQRPNLIGRMRRVRIASRAGRRLQLLLEAGA